ncbi:MAG: YdbL family protein [Proteobacteria bacterium]|nr:YdbL family protein [Pseudomonadota bacterium]MBU1388782.1 YdbL family protein [Pseudomonadota bacterium]MBU1543123.1 YdbL family protein [Pseudomonadota bacterium]MBU2429389.1 YdbL family protein [Pseudomonadota bacterium]MBU2481713.1 YdbL family protein [Pseudomonadota bacterium]
MKIFRTINICALLIAGLVFLTFSQASAREKEQIVQSMKDRIGVVNQLKASGVVGETYNGYLAFVGSAEKAEVVDAENKDRKELYGLVAEDEGTSIQIIEKNMGVVKAQRAKQGEFFQTSDGKWVKK